MNIARDLDLRYIVINRELIANTVGGAEYLREIEKVISAGVGSVARVLAAVSTRTRATSFTSSPICPRHRASRSLSIRDWSDFIRLLSSDLNLTRYYDLRHTVVSDDLTEYDSLALVTDDPHAAALDLYIKANPSQFFSPASNIFAFSPEIDPQFLLPVAHVPAVPVLLGQQVESSEYDHTWAVRHDQRAASSACRAQPAFALPQHSRRAAPIASCCAARPPSTTST